MMFIQIKICFPLKLSEIITIDFLSGKNMLRHNYHCFKHDFVLA